MIRLPKDVLVVPQDSPARQGYASTDFSDNSSIATLGLESCIAVATYLKHDNPKATLSHLTNRSDLSRFKQWFTSTVGARSNIYLVGGRTGESEELLQSINHILASGRYSLKQSKHVLGDIGLRDANLQKNGELYLVTYRMLRDAEGFRPVQIGNEEIVDMNTL